MVMSVLFRRKSDAYGHICCVLSSTWRLWSYLFCSVKHLAFMVISILFCQAPGVYGHICSVVKQRVLVVMSVMFFQASGVYFVLFCFSVKHRVFMDCSLLSNVMCLWSYLFCSVKYRVFMAISVLSNIVCLWTCLFCSVKRRVFMIISVLFCQTSGVYDHICSVLSNIGCL